MKDFVPDAQFNAGDEPIGDKRWFYHELYHRNDMRWPGPEPDLYSPNSETEERIINQALLEGKILPRNKQEQQFVDFVTRGTPIKKEDWPKKWCICKRCGSEWLAQGYPAKYVPPDVAKIISVTPDQGWFFPTVCQLCADYKDSFKVQKKKKPERKTRSVTKD